jgi:hypothetical protein
VAYLQLAGSNPASGQGAQQDNTPRLLSNLSIYFSIYLSIYLPTILPDPSLTLR